MASNPLIEFILVLLIIFIVFIVTYVVGLVIVKSKQVKKSNISLIVGFIFLIFGLISVLIFNHYEQIIFSLVGVCLVLEGAYKNKGYYNKTYYLSSLVILVLLELIFIYAAFFTTSVNLWGVYFLYITIGILGLGIVLWIRSYLRRHENPKMPWINEW